LGLNLGQKLLLEHKLIRSVIYTVVCTYPGQNTESKPRRKSSLEKHSSTENYVQPYRG